MKPTIKRKVRIGLDVLLTLGLITIFTKDFFGLYYHELAGLLILLPVLGHIVLNLDAVRGMKKSFYKVPLNIRLCFITDLLLMGVFLWLGISGVLISKKILTGISSDSLIFKKGHMFIGGLTVLLLGVHLGLHICRKELPVKLAAAMTIVILGCGLYGAVSSSMGRWISMPFTASTGAVQQGQNYGKTTFSTAENGREEENAANENGESPTEGRSHADQTWSQKVQTVIQFFGMMFSCAAVTYWIAEILKLPVQTVSECWRQELPKRNTEPSDFIIRFFLSCKSAPEDVLRRIFYK